METKVKKIILRVPLSNLLSEDDSIRSIQIIRTGAVESYISMKPQCHLDYIVLIGVSI